MSTFFSKFKFKFSCFLILFSYFLLILKSATAAEKIATSTGKFSWVATNISSAVSTFIRLISLVISRLVGPDINVVSKPFLDNDFANSYPCLPLDLFVIKRTGSMYSLVGPAVTNALNFLLAFKLKK